MKRDFGPLARYFFIVFGALALAIWFLGWPGILLWLVALMVLPL
jgi:hypothetical protein